jgi:predicted Fe-Mo cluster-binding NifX family protein
MSVYDSPRKISMNKRVAIPTDQPGGIDAARSDHFGHCPVFTIVDLDTEKGVVDVRTVANGSHEAGGCLVPVRILREAGVDAIVVAGMGARPMQGFNDAGITVYFASRETVPTVREAIERLTADQLPIMHGDQLCKGAGNCHH